MDDVDLADFETTMPVDYREAFDEEARRAHAAVVARRGDASTHIEIWRELPERVVAICVVADDQPGLFTRIGVALVRERFDVVTAHAFGRRRPDGKPEAVDVLFIRHVAGRDGIRRPVRERDIAALRDAIDEATNDYGQSGANAIVRAPEPETAGAATRVRFDTSTDGVTTLTVEAVDRPGLLLAVTEALFRAGIHIVGLRATTEQGCAVDTFKLTEADGRPLQRDRTFTLQVAILEALDASVLARVRASI